MPQGRLYVVAAPSGAGKTSLGKALMEREPRIQFSVSYTTRHPRPNEIPGRDYHFVSQERFQEMIAQDEFLEHAKVFDNCYGTGVRTGFIVVLAIQVAIAVVVTGGARRLPGWRKRDLTASSRADSPAAELVAAGAQH